MGVTDRLGDDSPTRPDWQLSVTDRAAKARRIYESCGFIAWGTELDGLSVGGESYAETHMALQSAHQAGESAAIEKLGFDDLPIGDGVQAEL
jgi:hypothetical protein